jgi:hypothetical protein
MGCVWDYQANSAAVATESLWKIATPLSTASAIQVAKIDNFVLLQPLVPAAGLRERLPRMVHLEHPDYFWMAISRHLACASRQCGASKA